MTREILWQQIHDAREALLPDLEKLTDEQWHTKSLCDKWTVQQVVAHMVGTATSTKLGFVKGMVQHKGKFDDHIDAAVRQYGSGAPSETLAAYRESMLNRTAPPGPVASWLGEAIVHAEDIRRPLGIKHSYNLDTLTTVADFYKESNLIIGAKKRIVGIELIATDVEWKTGTGPIASGPMLSLLMTMVGRPEYLDDLSGEGVAELRKRLGQLSTQQG